MAGNNQNSGPAAKVQSYEPFDHLHTYDCMAISCASLPTCLKIARTARTATASTIIEYVGGGGREGAEGGSIITLCVCNGHTTGSDH